MTYQHHFPETDSGANHPAGMGISEHTVVRVVAGETETLRARLSNALEQLGYRVLAENPLRAKHGARGAAAYYFSANALDYPTTLEIGLKPQGAGATRVTFDYVVMHGHYGKGDRQSLTREAEALIALAAQRTAPTSCAMCGADFVADSKFCRKCGAPTNAAMVPAELEVMRLTANCRAGHQWSAIGATLLALGTFLPTLIYFLVHFSSLPRSGKLIATLGTMAAVFGWWALLAGIRKTHLTLNPRNLKENTETIPPRHAFSVPRTNELPLETSRVPLSITEGTTSLLNEVARPERDPVSLHRVAEKPVADQS